MLFAFFLGIVEMIVLGAVGGAVVGVIIYFMMGSGKGDE
jgi:hypothetical protein